MTDTDLPNLLDGTTKFMELGRQLGTHVDPAMFATAMPKKFREFRKSLLVGADGEVMEYLDAEDNDDIVEIADGLCDTIVVSWGTLVAYIGPELAAACAREVVRSNLAKVLGCGLPIFNGDGKIMKPPGWTPPNIAGVLGVAR